MWRAGGVRVWVEVRWKVGISETVCLDVTEGLAVKQGWAMKIVHWLHRIDLLVERRVSNSSHLVRVRSGRGYAWR